MSPRVGGRKYEIIENGKPLPPETVKLGEALKKVFGLSDDEMTPVYVYPEEYLDDEEGQKKE